MKLPERLLKILDRLKALKGQLAQIKDFKNQISSWVLKPIALFRPSQSREPVVSKALLILFVGSGVIVGSVHYFIKIQREKALSEHAEKFLVKRGNGYEEYEDIDEEALLEEGELSTNHGTNTEDHGSEHASATEDHGKDSHAESEHPAEEAHGSDGTIKLGENPLPDEVVERQNGIPAAGYDLHEPQKSMLSRTMASDPNKALEVKVGNYYVLFDTIYGNARVGNDSEGALILSLNLEVDTFLARGEVDSRKQEFTGLINTVLYQFQKSELLTHEGKMALKKKIQEELNHKMKTGRIVDVFFSEIQMRP